MDNGAVHDELALVREEFRRLVAEMTPADLARRSTGTRWTNRELLFHLLFGYVIVQRLLWMVRLFGILPGWCSKPFAAVLNLVTTPFDVANYVASWAGGKLFRPERMVAWMDRVTGWLDRRSDRETERSLGRGMHYPTRWDPFFAPYLTVADLYRYPTRHFDFHVRQMSG